MNSILSIKTDKITQNLTRKLTIQQPHTPPHKQQPQSQPPEALQGQQHKPQPQDHGTLSDSLGLAKVYAQSDI